MHGGPRAHLEAAAREPLQAAHAPGLAVAELDAGLLRDLAQSATYVAREVEYAPPSAFAIEPLISYLLDTSAARDLLESATVEDGQEEALATAKTAVVEGLVAASLFIARTN